MLARRLEIFVAAIVPATDDDENEDDWNCWNRSPVSKSKNHSKNKSSEEDSIVIPNNNLMACNVVVA